MHRPSFPELQPRAQCLLLSPTLGEIDGWYPEDQAGVQSLTFDFSLPSGELSLNVQLTHPRSLLCLTSPGPEGGTLLSRKEVPQVTKPLPSPRLSAGTTSPKVTGQPSTLVSPVSLKLAHVKGDWLRGRPTACATSVLVESVGIRDDRQR